MPFYYNDIRSVVFYHIPKTGGTTVENWLTKTGNYKQLLFSKYCPSDNLVTPQHFGYESLTAQLGDFQEDSNYEFTVVRNPYDRLLSEFFYRLKLSDIYLGNEPEKLFSQWVTDMLSICKSTPSVLDNHLRPQVYFIGPNVKIFKFESGFKAILNNVADELGINRPENIESKKVGVKKNVVWSRKAIEAVKEFYAEDFEKFDYDESCHESFDISNIYNDFFNKCFYRYLKMKRSVKRNILSCINK